MGCTSSAPNTHSANASKEDKSIQFEEDAEETCSKHVEVIDTGSENRTEITVLPPSDSTETSKVIPQLVRNNKSTTSLESEKDLNTNGHMDQKEPSDIAETATDTQHEELDNKLSKLKMEVVDKFFEITQQEKSSDTLDDHNADETAESTNNENKETDTRVDTKIDVDVEENETNSEEPEDASPSQSQSSRATRWEALADIAAELPPSLAVDPITGQIYSLSK